MDLMRLDNAVPNAATCRSLELGVSRCMDEILEQVRRNTGLSITETQVERILQGKSGCKNNLGCSPSFSFSDLLCQCSQRQKIIIVIGSLILY